MSQEEVTIEIDLTEEEEGVQNGIGPRPTVDPLPAFNDEVTFGLRNIAPAGTTLAGTYGAPTALSGAQG